MYTKTRQIDLNKCADELSVVVVVVVRLDDPFLRSTRAPSLKTTILSDRFPE
jgi:hypothetical protein